MKISDEKLIQRITCAAIILVGRNRCGNKLTIKTYIPISEYVLREVEKGVMSQLNQRVTAFYVKTKYSKEDESEILLDFDAKLPYDRYPWQELIEARLKK